MTLAIARGQRKLAPRDPRVWFPFHGVVRQGAFGRAIAICFT